jgi:DNA-binding transcriptional LysR family regulator
MNIRWVVLFAMVAEEGSFTRAATRINIAQPWLSAQINKLETELGVKLLERLTSGVELTPEGRQLLPYAQTIAEATTKFRELARSMDDTQSKIVHIGSHLPMFDIAALRRLNDDFSKRYPNFSLRANSGMKAELLADMNASRVDFVVVASPISQAEEEFESVPLEPIKPYLLLHRTSSIAMGAGLEGQTIAAPSPASPLDFSDALLAPLRVAGAVLRAVPEIDKRAMEHFARTQNIPVVMIEGDARDYSDDPLLTTIALQEVRADHVLVRIKGRELGRAAERYWTMATALPSLTHVA